MSFRRPLRLALLVLLLLMAAAAGAQEAPPTDHIPEHLRKAVVYAQRDFHEAAQQMYLAQLLMNSTPEGLKFLNRQDAAKQKAKGMENYQQQAREYCAAAGLIYSAEQIICVPKPAVLGGQIP